MSDEWTTFIPVDTIDFPEEEENSYIESENDAISKNAEAKENDDEKVKTIEPESDSETMKNVEINENHDETVNNIKTENDSEKTKNVENENFSSENVVSNDVSDDVPDLHSSELQSVLEVSEDGKSEDIPE